MAGVVCSIHRSQSLRYPVPWAIPIIALQQLKCGRKSLDSWPLNPYVCTLLAVVERLKYFTIVYVRYRLHEGIKLYNNDGPN